MPLNPPPGYGSLVPLDRHRHAGLGLRESRSFAWCAGLNSLYLNAAEMPRAALDYPVAFVRDSQTGEFIPVAVLGLRPQNNVFVDERGRWTPHAYVPAYVRRHPFCLAEARGDGERSGEPRRIICVQSDQLVPSSAPLFDAQGIATAAWAPILQLIEAAEGARQQTRLFTRRIEAFGLLAPFDALAMPAARREHIRLQGLYRVDEAKLAVLGAREMQMLLRKGELRAIYAHLLSLEQFGKLMDLTVEADGRRTHTH